MISSIGRGGGGFRYAAYKRMCRWTGMVFHLSVLNRLYSFAQVCPKQGM